MHYSKNDIPAKFFHQRILFKFLALGVLLGLGLFAGVVLYAQTVLTIERPVEVQGEVTADQFCFSADCVSDWSELNPSLEDSIVVFPNPSSDVQFWQYTFGSNTWTKPAGVTYVYVEAIGGGAGGQGGEWNCEAVIVSSAKGGCGGGGGALAFGIFLASEIPSSVTVTVGAGGAGGSGSPGEEGDDGGESSFGNIAVAKGGGWRSGGAPGSEIIDPMGGDGWVQEVRAFAGGQRFQITQTGSPPYQGKHTVYGGAAGGVRGGSANATDNGGDSVYGGSGGGQGAFFYDTGGVWIAPGEGGCWSNTSLAFPRGLAPGCGGDGGAPSPASGNGSPGSIPGGGGGGGREGGYNGGNGARGEVRVWAW